MTKWSLEELRKHKVSYETLITLLQITNGIEEIYGKLSEETDELCVIFVKGDISEHDLSVASLYTFDSALDEGLCDVYRYYSIFNDGTLIDVSIIKEDPRLTESSLIDDLRNAVTLHEDIPVKLCFLVDMLRYDLKDFNVTEQYKALSAKLNMSIDAGFFKHLGEFALLYRKFGKRAAFAEYIEVCKYADVINAVANCYDVDLNIYSTGRS